jgi:hypothetical protein
VPRRAELGGVALLALAALALTAAAPTYPNYDTYFHLVWGRELRDGLAPSLTAYSAPTQHPLWIAVCAVVPSDRGIVVLCVLSLVALVWAALRLGTAVFGPVPALGGAAIVASSFALLLFAVRGYLDVPFLALVLWAAVLVQHRATAAPRRLLAAAAPPRGLAAPLGLLALAGLLRPEAWVLAGLLWLWRDRSLGGAVLVALAPVLWALVDLVVTGDPLRSLTGTSELAEDLGRERGLANVPGAFVTFLADALRPPGFAAALAGIALAWWRLGPRRIAVPLALLGAGTLTFVLTGAAGLSILPRYLTVPAVVLGLFAGYAVLGWTGLPRGRTRTAWAAGVAVLAVAGAGYLATRADVVRRLTTELAFIAGTHEDLEAILATRAVRDGLRCGPLTFPNYRLVPDSRWILDLPRGRVGARSAVERSRGVAVFVVGDKALRRYGFADGASPRTNAPRPGFLRVERRGRFVAYVACGEVRASTASTDDGRARGGAVRAGTTSRDAG